ncbi:hypothetical protein DFJ73DRAFT_964407 [Zopfochytrium polystomum]|nr:hypothetical protein DFJ73DRAFT_964407 [Zopfochytrium polystomum]
MISSADPAKDGGGGMAAAASVSGGDVDTAAAATGTAPHHQHHYQKPPLAPSASLLPQQSSSVTSLPSLPPLPTATPSSRQPPPPPDMATIVFAAPSASASALSLSQPHRSYALPVHRHAKLAVDTEALRSGRDYRDVAMAVLTNDFLNANDMSLEIRAYLVDSVIPTIIVSLDKLLKEAEKKGLLSDPAQGEIPPPVIGDRASVSLAPAAERPSLDPQPDRPKDSSFDPINWLGQFLYRNNPRYSNFSDPTSSPYQQQMTVVTKQLKGRLFEMQMNQRARKRAEELASKREEERRIRAHQQKMEEKKALFSQLLTTIFRRWTGKLWRLVRGNLTRGEMTDGFKAVLASSVIQSNDGLLGKVTELIRQFTMTVAAAEANRIRAGTPDSNQPSLVQLPPEYLSMDRWDQPTFVDGMMITTFQANWSADDLSTFLQCLAAYIDDSGDRLLAIFDGVFFCPRFPSTPDRPSSAHAIRSKLKRLINNIEIDSEDMSMSNLKANVLDYCSGDITLAQLGIDSSGAAVSFIGGGGGDAPKLLEGVTDEEERRAIEFETDFRKIMKVMVGMYGLSAAAAFMKELKKHKPQTPPHPPPQQQQDRSHAALEHAVRAVSVDEAAAAVRDLMRVLDDCGAGAFDPQRYNDAVDAAAASTAGTAALGDNAGRTFDPLKLPAGFARGGDGMVAVELAAACVAEQVAAAGVTRDALEAVARVLRAALDEAAAAAVAAASRRKAGDAAAGDSGKLTVSTAGPDRLAIQRRALELIRATAHNREATVAGAAQASLAAVADAMRALHPMHCVLGRVSLAETAVTRVVEVAGGAAAAEEEAGGGGAAGAAEIVETFLRFVAATPDVMRGEVVGSKTPLAGSPDRDEAVDGGAGRAGADAFEARVMAEKKPVKIDDALSVDAITPKDVAAPALSPGLSPTAVSQFLGVPFIHGDNSPVGVLGLTLAGEPDGGFVDADVKFIETASAVMLSAFDRIDARIKAINLAESSVLWARSKGDADVDIFLNEPDTPTDPPRFFHVLDETNSASGSEHPAEGASPADAANSASAQHSGPKVKEVSKDSEIFDLLLQTATAKEMINFPEPDGRTSTYIPVLDDESHVVAVMRLKPHSGKKGSVPDDDVLEIKKVVAVLETCVNHIHKEKFGHESALGKLAGESIDEESRRKMLFPKMMLLSAREYLSKLDNRSMSELRSYKKPPLTIHRVLKAVLYIFGYLPKEVKKWSDTVKLVNMDLLKQMIAYDPTAIQRKIRFKRCNRVLKLIPHGEVRKRGSLPTMFMYEWLLVTLELRERAVEARQRRSEVFQLVAQQDVGDGEGAADEEDGDDVGAPPESAGSSERADGTLSGGAVALSRSGSDASFNAQN